MSNTTEMLTSHEVRWRNYQQLIRSQKLIHHQIQLQNAKQTGLNGEAIQQNGNETNNQPENKTPDEKTKDGDPWENFEAGAAFLGPTLWDKRVPYDGQDFKLEYVDIEEFLNENGIPLDPLAHGNGGGNGGDNGLKNGQMGIPSLHHQQQQQYQQHNGQNGNSPPGISQYSPLANHYLAGPSRGHQNGHLNGHLHLNGHTHNHNHHNGHSGHSSSSGSSGSQIPAGHMRNMSTILSHTSRSPSPSESSSSMTSRDTPALSPDSTQPLGSFAKFDVPSFSLAEGAIDFDPRTRTFTEDELKPQPMIKKSKKQFVPDEQKDAKYWARRRKNNMAAKRSRDARRIKENQIAMRAGWLEKQNHAMKDEVERVHKENSLLKEKLGRCHCDH